MIYESTHGVETIKEVSSELENNSPGNSEEPPKPYGALGTIMQTASLSSAGKNLHSTSRKDKELSAHFT